MATTAAQSSPREVPEGRVLLQGASWGDYATMLEILGDRHIHVTFDQGMMEVRAPSQRHEQAAQLLAFFITLLLDELELDFESLGMTTWKRPDSEKGLEADQCYYIRNAAVARERPEIDLEVDPPPDLAIEVDITSSSINRLAIHANLGVPEVWRYDGLRLTMYQLQTDGRYQPADSSSSIRGLTSADVERFLKLGRLSPKRQWAQEIREWARDELRGRQDSKPS